MTGMSGVASVGEAGAGEGSALSAADLEAIREDGFYVWRGKKYAFEPARNIGDFSRIRCIGEADDDSH